MAEAQERDKSMVKVNLDITRFYRVNDADTEAIQVGPGEVEVPKWVAEAWGIATTKAAEAKATESKAANGGEAKAKRPKP